MTKEELISEIAEAFKDVELEGGIGLWEAEAIDDYADDKTLLQCRKKDERKNWDNISYENLSRYNSTLSFFDAKGMRFHLPKFLMYDLLEKELYESRKIPENSNVLFTLTHDLYGKYQADRFSLLNARQIHCIIHFLEYKMQDIACEYNHRSSLYGSSADAVFSDNEYIEINQALNFWKEKLL